MMRSRQGAVFKESLQLSGRESAGHQNPRNGTVRILHREDPTDETRSAGSETQLNEVS